MEVVGERRRYDIHHHYDEECTVNVALCCYYIVFVYCLDELLCIHSNLMHRINEPPIMVAHLS